MIAPGLHRFPLMDRLVHGQPAAASVREEADRLDRRRVFLVEVSPAWQPTGRGNA